MATKPYCIVFSHGFNSGLNSIKYRWLSEDFNHANGSVVGANLSPWPDMAMRQLRRLIDTHRETHALLLCGASLGGYYMQNLMQQYDIPAVLINPAIQAYSRLSEALGPQQNFSTGVHWVFTEAMREQLAGLQISAYDEKTCCLLSCNDELLDYQEALNAYSGLGSVVLSADAGHRFNDRELLRSSVAYMLNRYCDAGL